VGIYPNTFIPVDKVILKKSSETGSTELLINNTYGLIDLTFAEEITCIISIKAYKSLHKEKSPIKSVFSQMER
jgi:hypothetical protein